MSLLNEIRISDNIVIKHPVLLAPMAGITDAPYRYIVSTFGSNFSYSEMISSNALARDSKRSIQMASLYDNEDNIGHQIVGGNIELITTAAKKAEDMGAKLLDFNMGCPVKKVVKGIAGSALMKNEVLVAEILEALVKAVSIPVTLKMRLGWDYDNINSPKLAKIAEDTGIKLISVHGRTRQQMFSGNANWEMVKPVKDAVNIPVIVNGDIKDISSAKEALKASGADGIMIGRSTYGRPWLINQITQKLANNVDIPEPSNYEKYQTVTKHYDVLIDYYGKDIGLKVARKHIGWYTKGMVNSASLRAEINITESIPRVKSLIKESFAC